MGEGAVTNFRLHDNGTFDVLDARRVVFARAYARLVYRNARGELQTLRTTQQATDASLYGSDERVKIELRFVNDTLCLDCQNSGDAPIFLDAFEVLVCNVADGGVNRFPRAAEMAYFHHGWQSWSKTEIRAMTVPEISYNGDDFFEKHLPYGAAPNDERTGNAFMLIAKNGDEDATLLGFETGAKQFSQIRLRVENQKIANVRAVAYADGAQLDAGAVFESETLMIRFGNAGELYDAYARRVAKNMGGRGARNTMQGWCSWYYFFNEITANDIRANVQAIVEKQLPLDWILVDDGYETAIGDWTSVDAEKFPDGMKAMADEIHAVGKRAGIWLAPFGARHDSHLAREHPEFLLRDENGTPVRAWNHWGQDVYALDLTRTDVGEWLRELFRTVCFAWGYDAVKLDFLFAGALAGKPFDSHVTRAQAYRRGLEIIAETLGEEKIILACGAPQLASVGLVDTMRVSQDVNILWAPLDPANGGAVSTQHAIQNTLLRAPFNQEWWLNDPDCVMVRKRGDANAMTRHETRSLASIAALTASILLDSDHLANVPASHLQDLRRILPAQERTARVRTWFSHDGTQPSQLEMKLDNGERIYAAINWSTRTRETSVALPPGETFRVYDFWSKKDLGIKRGRVKILKHAPHQTIVLRCVPLSFKLRPNLQHIASA